MSRPTTTERIKQCKSLAEVARLFGGDSQGAILHILMLRDIETLTGELRGIKKALRAINGALDSLDDLIIEVQQEVESMKKLC